MVSELAAHVASVPLVDHHCHGVLKEDLDRVGFERYATESEWDAPVGTTVFDTPFGVALRAECAPLLDLPRHADPQLYLVRRAELGASEVNRRLLSATGIDRYIVETGTHAPSLHDASSTAAFGSAAHSTVARLEVIAEELLAEDPAVASFAERFEAALDAHENAVGFKTIVAYRWGLDFDPDRPSRIELERALDGVVRSSRPGVRPRIEDPVIIRHLIWSAVDRRKPLQFHVGFGDADVDLHRNDPSLMTEFIRRTRTTGASIMLLHCYPYMRQAAFLAHVYPHVYLDTGAAIGFTGASSDRIIREALELAPPYKVLFSSDAYGLPELYLCGARLWRRGIADVFESWVDAGRISSAEAMHQVTLIASENAERIYRL